MTQPDELLTTARDRGIRIALAESCTGGMISATITDVPGSSAVFDRGYVTYTNAAKMEMLGVAADLLDTYGAVSEPVAKAMAQGALDRSDAEIALSVSGIAGPGGSEHKSEGRVCFALATSSGVQAETIEFGSLGRGNVRAAAVSHALDLLMAVIVLRKPI